MRLSEWLTGLRQRFSRRSTTRVPARLRRRRTPQCVSGHQSEQFEDRTLLSIVSIAASDANAEESNGMISDPGTVQVTRTDSVAADLTINYTIAGSATNGIDYEILAGNVVIAAGASSAEIVVAPIDDLESEGNETVILTLSASSAYTVDADKNTSTVIIADDEGPVEVSLLAWDPDAAEWDSEAQLPDPGYVSVTRSGPTTDSLAVNFSIAGTATNGSDYQSLSSPVTIPAGESFKDIKIDPIDDSVCEGEESVVLTLSAGTGYTIDSDLDSGTVTIEDNDTPPTPTVSISATDDTAKEYGQDTGTFTFARTEDTCLPLTVNYNVGGDATSGTDYSPLTGSVQFAVGDEHATVTVTPTDDAVAELTETLV